jgi:hypothetical protein
LESGKIAVTLTIQSDAPTATSINIYGSDLPAGTLGISGNAKYTAVTNTGTTITDGT